MIKDFNKKIDPAWTGLRAAFGAAADASMPALSLAGNKKKSDMSNPGAVANELAEGCKKVWEIVADILAQPCGKKKADKDRAKLARECAALAASSQCASAVIGVVNAGMFEAAMHGFERAWREAPHGGLWEPAHALSIIARKSVGRDARGAWPEPLSSEAQLDLLMGLPCWAPTGNEWKGDPTRIWTDALTDLALESARQPRLSARSAALCKLSEPLWSTGVVDLEHFGRQMAALLNFKRFPNGQLDVGYWSALPFKVRLGVALGAKPETKLGSWILGRLVSESIESGKRGGSELRQLEDVCAGIWCGFDCQSIAALETLAPSTHEGWVAAGMARRFDAQNGAFREHLHYAQISWAASPAKWARKLASGAGLKRGDGNGGGKKWDELVMAIQALRQAQSLAKSLSPKSPSDDKLSAKALRRGRL